MTSGGQADARALPDVHEAWLPREHSLYRPRHGSRQVTALICALVFFTAPTLLWLLGARPAEIENHKLAGFPSVVLGWGFFTTLDAWANDNLVFRAGAIKATDWVSREVFDEPAPFDLGGGQPAGPLPGSGGEERTERRPAPGGPAGGADQAGFRRVIEGSDGWMYFGEDVLAKCRPALPMDETMRLFAALREAVEASGRTFVLVAVPDKSTMVPEHMPDSYSGKNCATSATPALWRKATTVARAMDLRPVLSSAADDLDRPVYYQQDSHWTHEGAIAAVRSLAESIRPGVTRRWSVDRKDSYRGAADLPPIIGRTGEKVVTRYRLEPDDRTNRARDEIFDLARPVRVTTGATTGMIDARTVVLGDSFLIAASPYLPAAFTDVTMLNYGTIGSDPGLVMNAMVDSEIVVFEVIERGLAGGLPMLNQQFIDSLRQELAKRPVS